MFIDPALRARIAVVALGGFIAAQTLEMLSTAFAPADGSLSGTASLLLFVTLIAAVIAVGCWIYLVNLNAHSFADGLSITPGWNVGWFFVPVANLWKPFEGLRETWQASMDAENWSFVPVPGLLRAWWGFWLVGSLLGNVAMRLNIAAGEVTLATALDLASSAAMVAAAALLIGVIRRLTRLQRHMGTVQVFA